MPGSLLKAPEKRQRERWERWLIGDVFWYSRSLKGMFNSAQFEGALANFQQLLSEGMFDSAELGLNPRVLQHFQQLLNVTDLTGSGWMERCSQLQHRSKRRGGSADFTKVLSLCLCP